MAPTGDPYRVLGLPPDAPLADVRLAYRRLAKANHPDTAGDAAVPRFLAIRAAYDELTGAVGGRRRGAATPAPQAWQADPDRARSTRSTWRSRAGRPPGQERDPGGGPQAGEAADASGPTARPGGARPGPRGRPTRRASRAADDRPPDRATPGSTSYDFAEHDPFDPEWTGASWYGQSSGTYWTINPKEYADPRKHGPEYQARGRRSLGEFPPDEPVNVEWGAAAPTEPSGPNAAAAGARPAGATASGAPARARAGDATAEAAVDAAQEPSPGPESPAGATRRQPRVPNEARRATASDGADSSWPPPGAAASPRPAPFPAHGATARLADDPLAILPLPPGPRARIALALLGWPPIGAGLALAIGEVSGCGRFSAACVETFALGPWIAQVAVLALLVAVPVLAGIAAVGSLSLLAAAVPAAVLLSAAGGSRDPATASGALAVVLAVAWTVGVVFATVRRARRVPS